MCILSINVHHKTIIMKNCVKKLFDNQIKAYIIYYILYYNTLCIYSTLRI